MYFAGIDPSLSSTAVVIIDESGALVNSKVILTKEIGKETGPARLAIIRDKVKGELLDARYQLSGSLKHQGPHHELTVAIEHYAMGCKFNREALGELGGVLRVMLFEKCFPYIEVPPLRLKQYATGKSSAEKDHILMAVYKKWGIEFQKNDEADAFILAQIARVITLVQRGLVDPEKDLKLTVYEREVIQNILKPAKKSKGSKGDKEAKGKKSKEAAA